jgi:hypothetical protein
MFPLGGGVYPPLSGSVDEPSRNQHEDDNGKTERIYPALRKGCFQGLSRAGH